MAIDRLFRAVALALTVLVGACDGGAGNDARGDARTVEREPTSLTSADVTECGVALSELVETGLIKEFSTAGRIVVDEPSWGRVPYKTKLTVLSVVSCRAWSDYVPPEGRTASAYGYLHGERLLTMTNDGVF